MTALGFLVPVSMHQGGLEIVSGPAGLVVAINGENKMSLRV